MADGEQPKEPSGGEDDAWGQLLLKWEVVDAEGVGDALTPIVRAVEGLILKGKKPPAAAEAGWPGIAELWEELLDAKHRGGYYGFNAERAVKKKIVRLLGEGPILKKTVHRRKRTRNND